MNHYLLDGHEVRPEPDLLTWARKFEEADRRVALTQIGDLKVSTVFLGVDHRFGDGPPLLFETMVFGPGGDEEQERYSTWEEAEAGHRAIVARLGLEGGER